MTTLPDALPADRAAIGPHHLTDALRAGGWLGGSAQVEHVEQTPFATGLGICGQLTLLDLRYAGPPAETAVAPARMVLKLPAEAPASRAVCQAFGFYVREGRFYADLAADLPVRTPLAYAAAVDLAGGTSMLLLEHIGGWPGGCQIAGATQDEARRAMDAAAALHAAAWDRALPADAWLERVDEGALAQLGAAYRASWPGFVDRFAALLPPGALELGLRAQDAFEELMHAATVEAPLTVCHGDYRLDNLLFSPDPAEPWPGRAALLDWQLMHRGPGVEDVALFLSQSLSIERRRSMEVGLLRRWHGGLCARLGPAAERYPLDLAWDHYRRLALSRTAYAVIVGGSMDTAVDRSLALAEAIAVRSFTAALDLDGNEFLT